MKISEINKVNQYLEEIITVKDSINKHKRLKELDLLEIRYKFEEERKEQELETALLEAKLYRNELTIVIIILVAGVVIFTLVFLFVTQRSRIRRKTLEQKNTLLEKEKLSKDLEFKNKELTTNVIYSIQKNKTLSELTEELLDIENTAVKNETKEAIKFISNKIQKSLDTEI